MSRDLEWPEVFSMVRFYFDRYIRDNEFNVWPNFEVVRVEFVIDDLNSSVNAYAARNGPLEYKIVLCAGLIEALTYEAGRLCYGPSLLFPGVPRQSGRDGVAGRACIWLMFIWLDFIFHHECAHIQCGHLELLTKSGVWLEVEVNDGVQSNGLSPYQRQRVEAQADMYAAANLIGMYGRFQENISSEIYGAYQPDAFLRDYMLAMYYLFAFLEKIASGSKARKSESSTHPSPFVRINICWHFFMKAYRRFLKDPPQEGVILPNLSPAVERTIFYGAFWEFCSREYGMTKEEFAKEMDRVNEFMLTVTATLGSLGLCTAMV